MSRKEEMTHISEELLERYTLLQLSEEKLAPVEEHLLVCERCRENLTEVENFVGGMKMAARQVLHGQKQVRHVQVVPKRPRQWTLPFASGMLISTLLIFVYVGRPHAVLQTEVALTASRGASDSTIARVPAGSSLVLKAAAHDINPGSKLRLELANSEGRVVWQGETEAQAGLITARLNHAFDRGQYWFRVYASDRLVEEYGLQVE